MGLAFRKKKDMPTGLWQKCRSCEKMVYRKQFEEAHRVCPECGHHHRLPAMERIEITLDVGTFEPFAEEFLPVDILEFTGKDNYAEKLEKTARKTGRTEAAIVGTGILRKMRVVMCVLDFSFFGGSMGQVVGERITVGAERALEEEVPLIIFSASGGARMQEGALSLMQMAKTSAAIGRLKENPRCPYISVLTDPTTGGVTASFATLGDFIVAEPGALIAFAGPRVIKATLRTDLPEGFQRSEFLLEHGFLDRVIPRDRMRNELAGLLEYCLV